MTNAYFIATIGLEQRQRWLMIFSLTLLTADKIVSFLALLECDFQVCLLIQSSYSLIEFCPFVFASIRMSPFVNLLLYFFVCLLVLFPSDSFLSIPCLLFVSPEKEPGVKMLTQPGFPLPARKVPRPLLYFAV